MAEATKKKHIDFSTCFKDLITIFGLSAISIYPGFLQAYYPS